MTRDLRRAAATMVVAIGVISLLYVKPIYQMAGPRTILWVYDLTVVTSALVGAGLSFLLWRSFSRGEVLKKIWRSLTLGLLLWTIAEVIWSYDQLLAGDHLPHPSLADIAWLAGYIAVAVGLLLRYRSLQMTPSKGWRRAVLWILVTPATVIVAIVAMPISATFGRSKPLRHLIGQPLTQTRDGVSWEGGRGRLFSAHLPPPIAPPPALSTPVQPCFPPQTRPAGFLPGVRFPPR